MESNETKVKNKAQIVLIIVIFTLILILGGVTYAFFNYTRVGQTNTVSVGRISFTSTEGTAILLENATPISSTAAQTDTVNTKTLSINVVGDTDYSEGIEYLLSLTDVNVETSTNKEIPISLLVSVSGSGLGTEETGDYYTNRESYTTSKYKVEYSKLKENAHVLVGYIAPNTTSGVIQGINGTINIKAFINSDDIIVTNDSSLASSDKTVITTEEWNSLQGNNSLSFRIKVEAREGIWVEEPPSPIGYKRVLRAVNNKINAETNACNPIWIDDMDTTNDETDDITYFSGTNDCVDMNYVWYSGKLWRITAIYPDGSMKLITENNITSIAFYEDASSDSTKVNFYNSASDASYMYQWLNEDFYDTLYNACEFIDTGKKWNATMPENTIISTKPAETNMVDAKVGLLNSYEYYNSYRCIGSTACTGSNYGSGYLNIGYYWWLLNPYSASDVRRVSSSGYGGSHKPADTNGGRPSIYLKSGLEFTGSGTTSDPYKIVGDKAIGSTNDLVNTRLSGEYVKLKNGSNEQLFRIIDVEDNKTKIIAMDYADNNGTRKFATSRSDTLWGSGTTTGTDTWYDYLNNTYLPNLKTTYNELFDSSTYYLGTSGNNYKLSVCANATGGSTKECTKTTQSGTFNIGLPRYGEMFATQQSGGYSNSIDMWLINRYSASYVRYVRNDGNGVNLRPANSFGGRPTLHLKSTVKILSCDSDICDGTQNHPYVVGL